MERKKGFAIAGIMYPMLILFLAFILLLLANLEQIKFQLNKVTEEIMLEINGEDDRGIFKNQVATLLSLSQSGQTYQITDGVITPDLGYSGDLTNYNGKFYQLADGSTAIIMDNRKYCAYKLTNFTDVHIQESGTCESSILRNDPTGAGLVDPYPVYQNGTAIYFNPETGTTCDAGSAVSLTGTKTGCMKWYIFNDSSQNNTVNMILDHNTTASVMWNSSGSNETQNEIQTTLINDTSTWIKDLSPRLIEASEIATITGNSSFDVATTTQDGFFYFDTNTTSASGTCTKGSTSGCQYGWLYDRTYLSCTDYGCNNNSDVQVYGYWTGTKTAGTNNTIWSIYYYGIMDYNVANHTAYGLRPVITVTKSQL